MDLMTVLIEAGSGALGANISGKLVPPQEIDGTLLNTIIGVVGGVAAAHFAGGIVGTALSNLTEGQAIVSGIAGFLLVLIVKMVRNRSASTI